MSFVLTPEQEALRDDHRRLGRELGALLADHPGPLPDAAWRWCGERGVLGLNVATADGGAERSPLDAVLTMEGLGQGCSDLGFLFAANAHVWGTVLPLATLGTPEQKTRWLTPLIDGSMVGAHCITEPGAGSDVRAMTTSIERVDGRLRINGHKHLITAAPRSGVFLVYARDPAFGDDALSCVVVARDAPGVRVTEQKKLGLKGAPMGEVFFNGVEVDESAVLGGAGAGMAQFSTALEWERAFIFAPVLGAMERQLKRTIGFARRRQQFGKSIGRFQGTANRIVDMKMRLDVGRLLLYQVASLKVDGGRTPMEASQAKLYISEAHVQSSLDAMQVRGGLGYLEDAVEAEELRDAPAGTLYSGSSEVQRVIIGRFLGL